MIYRPLLYPLRIGYLGARPTNQVVVQFSESEKEELISAATLNAVLNDLIFTVESNNKCKISENA